MKKQYKNIITLIVVIAIVYFIAINSKTFLGASIGQGGTSEITRTLSSTNAMPGDEVVVSYVVNIGSDTECGAGQESTCNDFYVIEDLIPVGVQVSGVPSPTCDLVAGSPQRMVCIVLQDAVSTTLSYKITIPDTQEVSFSGSYMVQGDLSVNSLYGGSVIGVTPSNPIQGCVTDWQCSSYGEWSTPSQSCGVRSRSCIDMNDCGTNVGKPLEIETKICGVINDTDKAGDITPKTGFDMNIIYIGIIVIVGALLMGFGKKKSRRKRR